MNLNATDSQKLLLDVLSSLSSVEIEAIMGRIELEKGSGSDEDIFVYLYRCINFVLEKHRNNSYCDSFLSTSEAVVAKISSQKRVLIKDIWKAYNWNNAVQLNRITKKEAILQKKNIDAICSKFTSEVDKRFWSNQLLSFFPASGSLEAEEGPADYGLAFERRGLNLILEIVFNEPSMRNSVLAHLPDQEKAFLVDWKQSGIAQKRKSKLGEAPVFLYDAIVQLLKTEKRPLSFLIDDVLQTKSWYIWKGQWCKARENDFCNIPEARIQRWQIFLIAVEFELDLIDTLCLLQLAGYRLDPSGLDNALWRWICYGDGEKQALEMKIWAKEICL